MGTIDRSVLIQIANEHFARVVYLAATSKPGCKVARKHLREASKHGLDAKAFVEADGNCFGWSLGPYVGVRAGFVPRISLLWSDLPATSHTINEALNREPSMKTLKHAVVFPIVTGDTWCETAPPIRLPRDSKAAALRALRDAGYRVMHKGGELAVYHWKSAELVNCRRESPEVTRVASRIGADIQAELDGPADIAVYMISVYP